MARKRIVSRTITTTTAKCMVCDTKKATVSEKELVLSLKLTAEQALKQAQKTYETDTEKIVAVTSVEYNETLYAMPELEFLKYAKPITKEEAEQDTEEDE